MRLALAIALAWLAGAALVCLWIHGATRRPRAAEDLAGQGEGSDAQAARALAQEAIAQGIGSESQAQTDRRSEGILVSHEGPRPQGLR